MGLFYSIYLIWDRLFHNTVRDGFASIMCSLLILSGVILVCLGIIGEYIARIYIEVKHRPVFIIDETNIEISPEEGDNM